MLYQLSYLGACVPAYPDADGGLYALVVSLVQSAQRNDICDVRRRILRSAGRLCLLERHDYAALSPA
jgi:hypothetical protein